MAIPIWVPILLAAASFGANYAGQKKTDKARAAALEEARRLREEKSRETEASAKKTADLFANHKEKEADTSSELEQEYTAAIDRGQAEAALSDALTYGTNTGATSTVATPRASDQQRGKLARHAKTMAKLGAFGDVMVGNEIASARNRTDIGRAGSDMMAWNQNVLPMQLEAANMQGRNFHTLADVLQAASMLTSFGAMSGASSVPANIAPATTGTEFATGLSRGVTAADAAANSDAIRRAIMAGYA